MNKKEIKVKNWMVVVSIIITIMLIFMAGISLGLGKPGNAICNALWAVVSYFNVRSLIASQEMKEVNDATRNIVLTALTASILKDAKKKKDDNSAPSCSAENNDNIAFHNIAEEVGGDHE